MNAAPAKSQKQPPSKVRRAILKLLRFLIILAIILLLGGFLLYWINVERAAPPKTLIKADGIVILTGKGGGRLKAGADLLARGYGERLLISGVNPANTSEKMQSLLALQDLDYSCCVDLDYEAENTFDNGRETSNWARALGYETIYLVTSSYHMPRAKVEISSAIDRIEIIPYPVKSRISADAPWWGGKEKWVRRSREYGKLLLAYARDPGARPDK